MNVLSSISGTMTIVIYIVTCLIIGIFTSWLAGNKGYENRGTWFFVGFLFGFIGFLSIGLASNKRYEKSLKKDSSFSSNDAVSILKQNSNKDKICSSCGASLEYKWKVSD